MSFSSSPCHSYAGEARFGRVVLSQTGHRGSQDPIEESWDPRRPPTRPQRSSEKPAGCAGGGRRGRRLIVTLAQGLGLRLRRWGEQGPEIESPPHTHAHTLPSARQKATWPCTPLAPAGFKPHELLPGYKTLAQPHSLNPPPTPQAPRPRPHAPGRPSSLLSRRLQTCPPGNPHDVRSPVGPQESDQTASGPSPASAASGHTVR